MRCTNDTRRRPAAMTEALGREGLNEISDLVTPDTPDTSSHARNF